jgi:hypothetical protein
MSPQPATMGGFSPGELKFASFWVRNRFLLARLGRGALIGLNVLLWGYVFWGILDTYAISYPRESRLTQEIATNQIMLQSLEADRPQNIATANVQVFQATDNRYDMAVDISNPNANWWAEFNYRFNLSGAQTPLKSGFILPSGQSVLTELGYSPETRGGATAQLVVENIFWHRVDPAQVGASYAEYAAKVFKVSFENIQFTSDLIIGTQRINRTSFDVVNRGSYGYWTLGLAVRLYRGSSVLAVNEITLQRVAPGETRHVDLDWFESLPAVTKTEIIPIVNLLDRKSFLSTEYF